MISIRQKYAAFTVLTSARKEKIAHLLTQMMRLEINQISSRPNCVMLSFKVNVQKEKNAALLMVKMNSGQLLIFSRLPFAISGLRASVLLERPADLPMAMMIFDLPLLTTNSKRRVILSNHKKVNILRTTTTITNNILTLTIFIVTLCTL